MDLGGYTGIPEKLEEAQATIVRLLDEQGRSEKSSAETLRALNRATAMIRDARAALNAVEAPEGAAVRHPAPAV
jgi:hypothetical protein